MIAAVLLAAIPFTWWGMVLAISGIEAPLKFRAPGVTTRLGLGIGRLVFRALNIAEIVLAVVLVAATALVPVRVPARGGCWSGWRSCCSRPRSCSCGPA